MTDFKYNKDQAKKVYDQIASNGGMTSSESEFYDKLNDTEYVKKVYNTLNEDGIQLLDAPDEKSFLDSLGFNATTTLEPTNIVKEEKTAAEPVKERAEEVKNEPILPVNMEPASAIVANETPEERVQGGAKQIGEDKFSDVAVVNDMLANANQELADWKNANDAFMTEFDRRKSQFADDRLAYTEQWTPRFFNKQSKKDQDFINANSAKYSELQRQRRAIQGKIDMLDTIRQYSEYDASVAKGEALSAMVDRKELSEEDMKELRSISDEKERNAYLENLRDSGKITDETFKNIYNLGDVSSKNALAYGLFKTGKLKDMATIGLTELERSINIREIAERNNNGLPLTDEESSLLDIYDNLAKIENQDRSIWFDLGKGAQQSVRFMMEMALTGGASGLGKAIGTKGILALAKQVGTKKALGMAAKNAVVRGGQSAMYQAVMTPVSPSTYIDFNNRVAGLNLEGKDISGADLLKEYYKAGVGTFADKISETMSGILDDARFLSILANSKPTNKVLQKGLELSVRLGDSQAYKIADRTLKGLGINSVPAEMLEEVGANIIRGTLGVDKEALEQLTDGEFYLKTAMQSVLFGGVGAGIRYGAGAIAASSQEKQIKKEYERAANNLKDEQFSNERLNELKEILIDAMDNGNYIGKDGSVETGDVYSTFKQLQDEVLISGTIEDRKAFNTADNAVRFGLFNDGKNRAVKALVEQRYGEFENEDGNVYEVTDQEGNSYFILDETDNSVVLVDRATKGKVVKPKSLFKAGSVKQTNANEWALNEVLLNANKWNAEDAISAQQETQPQQAAERPADILYINGNAAHVVKYDPNTGIYTVLDEQGQEAEYSLNEEGVVPAWIEDNTQQKEQTGTPLKETNTADLAEGKSAVGEVEQKDEKATQIKEDKAAEEKTEPVEFIVPRDKDKEVIWSEVPMDRFREVIDSELGAEDAAEYIDFRIKDAKQAVSNQKKRKAPKNASEFKKFRAEARAAQAELDYWTNAKAEYTKPVEDVVENTTETITEETPVAQTRPVFKNTSDSVLQEGVTPYTVGENIKQRYNDAPKVYGAEDTYTDAEGNTYKGRWVVTEADAVTPSHNAETLQPSEGFPVTDKGRNVNDNDYSNKRSIVETMAADYDSRALDEPVVVSEGAIVSGNNRTISRQISAQKGTDKKYREVLPSKAQMRGVSAEDLAQFKNPTMVFELAEPIEYTTEAFAKFNRPRSKTKSPVDMAIAIGKQDTSRLVGQVLDTIGEVEKLGDLYQNQAKVATIMKQIVESGIINQNEMPQFYTEEYSITDAGKDFIETLLVGSVINEDQIRILNTEGMKQYREKIVSAMLPIAKNLTYEDNISKELNTAIKYLKEARDAKTNIKGILLDNPMFDKKDYEELAIFTALMLQRKPTEFRQYINNLNERAELGGDNLFGERDNAQSVLEDYKQQNKLSDYEQRTINLAEEKRQADVQGVSASVQGDGTNANSRGEGSNGAVVPEGQTEVENENPLFRAKSDEEIAELDKVYEKYQERLNNVDIHIARYKKAGMSIPQAFMNERRKVIEAFLSEVLDIPYTVATRADFVSKMQEAGCSQKQIDNAIDALSKYSIPGFYVRGQIFFITDDIADIEDARQTLIHERQHYLTSKDRARLTNAVFESVDSVEELDKVVENLSETDLYVGEYADVLADEFLSFAMQIAYTDANFAEILKEKGVNDKLITLITEINNGQANQESLSKARRGRGRNVYGSQSSNRSSKQDGGNQTAQSARVEEQRPGSAETSEDGVVGEQIEPRYSKRTKPAPKNTGKGYKVFVLKDGKLYPPMVANPNGEATPVGVWLDADAAPISGQSKTGRNQVKAGGKGTQGGSGSLAYRPGWHLGEIPYALQFNRKNPNTGEKELFPANFVWAEVEYADDVNYQEEAMNQGVNQNGKFQHSLAGLQRVPEDGSYRYRTNPNPETDPWIITGAMKVNRILTPSEVDVMVREAGREPQQRQEGAITDEQVNKLNTTLGLSDSNRAGEDNQGNPINGEGDYILTEVDDISEITDDDFINPTRNIKLPALPKNVNDAIGGNNKPVIIKRNIFIKNRDTHKELLPQDGRDILSNALYNPNLVGQTQPIRKPNYKVAVHTADKNSVVILDVYENNKNIEIIGWRKISNEGLERMKKQAKREGGQFLILSPENRSAAALSTLPSDLLSDDKDNQKTNTNKSSDKKVQSDKNKALDYISVPAPIAGAQYSQELDSATKVIESFENPTINNENGSEDDIRFRSTKPFYSNAEKAVEGVKQDKATSFQWIAMLSKNGGLKAAEDKWLGLSDWLREQKGPVTKQQILDFIEQNKIQIEEVHYTDAENLNESLTNSLTEKYGNQFFKAFYIESWQDYPQAMIEDLQSAVELYNQYNEDKIENNDDLTDEQWDKMLDWGQKAVDNAYNNAKVIDSTRLDYTTAGLENKKEIALTVPTIEPWNENDNIHFGDAGNGRAVAWIRFGDTTTPIEDANSKRRKEITDRLDELSMKVYSGGLTVDEFNERADLRKELDDMPENENQKVLVIDEIQSKRHQDARELGGYRPTNIDKFLKDNNVEVVETGEFYEFIKDGKLDKRFSKGLLHYDIEKAKNLYVSGYAKSNIPAAPFEKNWHELAMKRMLRYAAENGYDKIAWTTGEQQAQRYSLGRFFSSIERQDNPSMEGRRFVLYGGNMDSFMVNDEGIIIESTINESVNRPLSDVVGKELSVKMMQMKDGDELEDADIVIGGEGMKGFYDKMLVDFMNKYGKKWGVKVQDLKLQDLGETMHSMDVTDAMVDSVMEGQPMFRGKSKRFINRPAGSFRLSFGGPITNKSKFGSVDKIIQYSKDNAIAIKNLQNEVIRRGGTINDDSDAYNQVPLSTKKAAFDVAYFDKAYYTPMLQQLTKAAKLFAGKGVSILDARDKVVSFLYARHAPERNRKIAIDKIKENVYGELGSQIMSNNMSDFINDIIPIIYDNSYKSGTSTYDISSLSTEQTKVYNNAITIINDWIAAHPIVNLSGVTDKQAEMIMHNMYDSQDAKTKAELDKLSDTIRDCNEYTLEKWLEYGLISKDEYDATKNMYQYYIPLRGWEDKENIDYEGVGGRAYNRAGDVISLNRRALGRTSKAEAPIEHIRMMAVSAAVSGNRNLIRQKAYNLIAQNADLIEDLATIDSEAYKQAKTKTQQKMHEVDVFIDGDKRTYAFLGEHGVATAQAVTGKNKGDMNIVERHLSKLTRAQSMMLTSLNAAFLPVNMAKDFGYGNIAYYIKYGGKDWGKFFKNYFIGLGQSFLDVLGANPTSKNAQLYQDYKRNGGQTGFVHIEELERLKHNTNKIVRRYSNGYKKVGQQVVNLIPQLLRVIGEPMENAARFAAYKTLVERGESPRQAAIAAGEITVNFNRKGTTRAFPMMYAFFNAAMEGTRNFFDLMTGGDNAQKMRASMVMATLMATSFGLAMMAKGKGYEEDEEEFEKSLEGLSDEDKELMRIQRGFANSYNRVSPYVRNTNILIPTASKNEKGDMKFIAIPLPQSFRVINACGRILADLVSGDIKPDEAFKEMFFFSIGEFVPFDIENLDLTSTDKDNGTALQRFLRVAAPTPLRASAEIATNRDFMGNPIYRESYINSPKELNKPLFLRAYDDTPEFLVGAAEELNEWLGGSENVGAKVQTAQNGLTEDNWRTILALFLDNTNISNPAAVDHFLKGFFGGFYTMGIKAYQWATSDEPIPAEETFIVDRFVKVPTARPGMKSYFELLDAAEESKVSIEDKEARGVDSDDKYKYGKMLIVVAEKSKEEIAKLNEIIYAIKGIDKPTDEQKQALKEVQKQRDEIMKLAGAAYEYIIAKAEVEKKTDETNTGNRN